MTVFERGAPVRVAVKREHATDLAVCSWRSCLRNSSSMGRKQSAFAVWNGPMNS